MATHISDVCITTFLKGVKIKNPARFGHESVAKFMAFLQRNWIEKIQDANLIRSIQWSHFVWEPQVGTEVDDHVYFSPLRGNAWKPRSWENMGQVQKLWLLVSCYFDLREKDVWTSIQTSGTSSAKMLHVSKSIFPKKNVNLFYCAECWGLV